MTSLETPRIYPEHWVKDRNLALVIVKDKPAQIVAEFGSNSVSLHNRRAALVAEAPEAINLLNFVLESLTEEVVDGYEARFSDDILSTIQRCIERATGKHVEIASAQDRNRELKARPHDPILSQHAKQYRAAMERRAVAEAAKA
mgnify:CR=1 FL=1